MRSQAHRTDPMHVLGAILFVVGAAIVAGAAWFGLSLLFSMGHYIQSVLP